MENQQLQKLVEEISLKDFARIFRHQAFFNSRLRTTGGRYLLRSHDIEINKKYYDERGIEELIGIIKHELCHYHLHLEGRGYQHKDADFKKLLKQVGAPRFCTPLSTDKNKIKQDQKIYQYACKLCSQLYSRKRRINTTRYVCGTCKGKLFLVDSKEV
ncbi:SprT family protein [Peribacillus loiseleuriae]|uniref:SprT family protein n=1 Tax=Peribacillus loiseleuriae TaxID=1679170 RepID=UPI003D01F95E